MTVCWFNAKWTQQLLPPFRGKWPEVVGGYSLNEWFTPSPASVAFVWRVKHSCSLSWIIRGVGKFTAFLHLTGQAKPSPCRKSALPQGARKWNWQLNNMDCHGTHAPRNDCTLVGILTLFTSCTSTIKLLCILCGCSQKSVGLLKTNHVFVIV